MAGLKDPPLIFAVAPFCCDLVDFSAGALVAAAADVVSESEVFTLMPLVVSFGDCFVACDVLGFGKPEVDNLGDDFRLAALLGMVDGLGLLVVCGDLGCSFAFTSDTVLGWVFPVMATVLSCGCLSCGKKLLSAALCPLVTSEPIGILGDPEPLPPFVIAVDCSPETPASLSSADVVFVPPCVPSKEDPFNIEPSPPSTEVFVIWRACPGTASPEVSLVSVGAPCPESFDVLAGVTLGPFNLVSSIIGWSLVFFEPDCSPLLRSLRPSTATKLALTLLTGRL